MAQNLLQIKRSESAWVFVYPSSILNFSESYPLQCNWEPRIIFHIRKSRRSDIILIMSGSVYSVPNGNKMLVPDISSVTQAPQQDFLPSKNSLIGVDDEASVPSPLDSVQSSMERHNCFGKQTMENLFDKVQKANKQWSQIHSWHPWRISVALRQGLL